MAVIRRLAAGKSPFAPDRLHIHHRLLGLGHSHLESVLVMYMWSAVFAFGAIALFRYQFRYVAVIGAVAIFAMVIVTAWPVLRKRLWPHNQSKGRTHVS